MAASKYVLERACIPDRSSLPKSAGCCGGVLCIPMGRYVDLGFRTVIISR